MTTSNVPSKEPIISLRSSNNIFTSFQLLSNLYALVGSMDGTISVWYLPMRKCIFKQIIGNGSSLIYLEVMLEKENSVIFACHARSKFVLICDLMYEKTSTGKFICYKNLNLNILHLFPIDCYTFLTAKYFSYNGTNFLCIPSKDSTKVKVLQFDSQLQISNEKCTPYVSEKCGTLISYCVFERGNELSIILGYEDGSCLDYDLITEVVRGNLVKIFNSMITTVHVDTKLDQIYFGSVGNHLKVYNLTEKILLNDIEVSFTGIHHILPLNNFSEESLNEKSLLLVPWVGIGLKKLVINVNVDHKYKEFDIISNKDHFYDGISNVFLIKEQSPSSETFMTFMDNLHFRQLPSIRKTYVSVLFNRDTLSIYALT